MAIDNSKIILGLPSLPSDNLPKDLYDDFLSIHKAIKNLLDGVSIYTGIDAPSVDTWSQSNPAATLLSGNSTRLYVTASVVINAGQIVNLYDSSAGVLKARLANSSSATTMAHGLCTETVAAGAIAPLQWLRAYVNSIGGMTPGILYWLSTTAGAVQNIPPVAAGTIQQPIGVAFAVDQLLMDIPLSYKQN